MNATPDQTMTPLPDAPPSSYAPRQVRLIAERGRTALFVDDLDFSSAATRVDLSVDSSGQPPEVVVHLMPGTLHHDGEAAVKVDDRTRAVLLALGWAPPEEMTTEERDALGNRFLDFLHDVRANEQAEEATPEGMAVLAVRLANVVANHRHQALKVASQ